MTVATSGSLSTFASFSLPPSLPPEPASVWCFEPPEPELPPVGPVDSTDPVGPVADEPWPFSMVYAPGSSEPHARETAPIRHHAPGTSQIARDPIGFLLLRSAWLARGRPFRAAMLQLSSLPRTRPPPNPLDGPLHPAATSRDRSPLQEGLHPYTPASRLPNVASGPGRYPAVRLVARLPKRAEAVETTTYAVIKTGGKQYRVAQGDRLRVEKLPGNVGDAVTFSEVLMVATEGGAAKIGKPLLAGAIV